METQIITDGIVRSMRNCSKHNVLSEIKILFVFEAKVLVQPRVEMSGELG